MSTEIVQNTNKLLAETEKLRRFLNHSELSKLRTEVSLDWSKHLLIRAPNDFETLLVDLKLLERTKRTITDAGRVFLGRLLIDIEQYAKVGSVIDGRYRIDSKLVGGKNSITFRATHVALQTQVVIKIFRPARGEGIVRNIARVAQIRAEPYLVGPLDLIKHRINDASGAPVDLDVLIYPYIEGMTFRAYLATEKNYSPTVIQAYIEQVGYALAALEKGGLNHGDVHSNNVMVTTEPGGKVGFRLIDLSYGADDASDYELPASDAEGFKLVLMQALDEIEKRPSRLSLRRYLGARIYSLVQYILTPESKSFVDIQREVETASNFTEFAKAKADFVSRRFSPPKDFGILRYEEIEDPNVALQLFFPFRELFAGLSDFGSAVLFGHRGTGKSTYLAAITFHAEVKKPLVDFREIFGVLFSCRQGEFRKFSTRNINLNSDNRLLIKDILIKKIVRKTLDALAAGVDRNVLEKPANISAISSVVLRRLQLKPGLMITHQISEIDSLRSTVLQAEIAAVDRLFAGEKQPAVSELFDEHSLGEVFAAIRTSFSELNQARFAVLFDDAGAPNVAADVQDLICDLIASTNSTYCVKVSAEKTTFRLRTSEGKALERGHDYRAFTISDYLYLGPGISPERHAIEAYFRELVSLRLKVCGYQSSDIRHYLGDHVVGISDLVRTLAGDTHSKPQYAGWHMVWQIADRTARHLIEMISTIFTASLVIPSGAPKLINVRIQTKQILRFSEDKFRGLMFLPGTIEVAGRQQALGKRLFEFAASFGRVSNFYLRNSEPLRVKKRVRFDEKLAIEVDNALSLSADGQRMLDALIRFAIVDDEQSAASFDDGARKPLYIFNRVYCPILGISFRRDSHWRLSSQRFDEFLRDPTGFVRSDKRLEKMKLMDLDEELFK